MKWLIRIFLVVVLYVVGIGPARYVMVVTDNHVLFKILYKAYDPLEYVLRRSPEPIRSISYKYQRWWVKLAPGES